MSDKPFTIGETRKDFRPELIHRAYYSRYAAIYDKAWTLDPGESFSVGGLSTASIRTVRSTLNSPKFLSSRGFRVTTHKVEDTLVIYRHSATGNHAA